jgi:hypothetical protein
MQIELRGRISRPDAAEYAKKRVRSALDHLSFSIPSVQVRLGQQDGDAVCRLVCELRFSQYGMASRSLVVEASSDNLVEAIEHAADRAAERAERVLGKGRERPSGTYLVCAETEDAAEPWTLDSEPRSHVLAIVG